MTEVYFIRHAEADYRIKDEYNRPLTEKGLRDAAILPERLKDISPDVFFCSPYIRTIQTITPLARKKRSDITIKHDLRERLNNSEWIHDEIALKEHVRKMWNDLSGSVDGGESVKQLQDRNIRTLDSILRENEDKVVIVGTHGTALASIINYYDNAFSGDDFIGFVGKMPYVVRMKFQGTAFVEKEEIPYERSHNTEKKHQDIFDER